MSQSANVGSAGGRMRKLSLLAGKPLPSPPLTAEQIAVQTVPKDAAMLELIPRGDVFASHKLAPYAGRDQLPPHIGEKLALFEQSFPVLRFPHKTYNPVVLDPPQFNQTFHVDTVVLPSAAPAGSGNGAESGESAPPLSALLRTQKSSNLLQTGDNSVESRPTKLKAATVADVFESLSLAEGEQTRARVVDSSCPPLPLHLQGTSAASRAVPSSEAEVGAASAPAVVTNPYTAESLATVSNGALPLRSYFPQWDWGSGAETALCERVPLPVPSSRAGTNTVRFLFHAKSLQLSAGGRDIEPLFCELALYNVAPDARCKVSDTFSVQLNPPALVKMVADGRAIVAKALAAANPPAAGAPEPELENPLTSPFVPTDFVNPTSASPCTRALFSLPASSSSPRPQYVLILLVYKILQGKLDSSLDLYAKSAENSKEKEIRSAEVKAQEASRRWPEHRQLLVWGASPVLNDAGVLRSGEDISFRELYKQPKSEEAFTVTSLCDAAASVCGKTRNPKGYKQIPGAALIASAMLLPASRGAALAEAEKVAPVYNSNMVPVRMEEVVESAETICIGHEVLASNIARGQNAAAAASGAELTVPSAAATPATTGASGVASPTKSAPNNSLTAAAASFTAAQQGRGKPAKVVSSLASGAAATDSAAAPTASDKEKKSETSSDAETLAAGSASPEQQAAESVATIATEEWVEVDAKGSLIRKRNPSTSNMAPSTPAKAAAASVGATDGSSDADKESSSATGPAPGLSVSVTSPVGDEIEAPMSPMSPSSRALIALDHGRQRSYVLPPSGKAMSACGYITEIENVAELHISPAAAPSAPSTSAPSPSHSASAAAAGGTPASSPTAHVPFAGEDSTCPFHLHYQNHLYIYPQSITFSDARNVAIHVQVKDTHESAFETAMDLIYPRADELLAGVNSAPGLGAVPSSSAGSFVTETYTATTYHCYDSAFVDEIRIELPLVLKPSHHVLFTFYNVSCKDTPVKGRDGQADDHTLLGYAMLPLYLDSRIVDEAYTLPVCAKLRPHYLLQKDEWDNRRNALFSVKLRVQSSLYTNDPFLNRFFLKCILPYAQAKGANGGSSADSSVSAAAAASAAASAVDGGATVRGKKPALTASADEEEEMLAVMLKKVLRSGQLKKKGGLKWTERWWTLTDTSLIVFKSQKDGSKIWHHTTITPYTQTLRNAAAHKGQDDDLKYAWSIRADGVPSGSPGAAGAASSPVSSLAAMEPTIDAEPSPTSSGLAGLASPGTVGAEDMLSPSATSQSGGAEAAASPSSVTGGAAGATLTPASLGASTARASVASPPASFSSGGSGSNIAPGGGAGGSGSMTAREPVMGAGSGAAFSMGLDAVSFEPEMSLMADSEEEMYSWLKAIAHAKLSRASLLDSIRAVRESQVELLVQHLPSIMRLLLNVICTPEGLVDGAALAAEGASLERMKHACFETMLEVAYLVETGTATHAAAAGAPSAAAAAAASGQSGQGEKQRNVYLDTFVQYVFDDNSSSLPIPAARAAAAAAAAAAASTPAGAPTTTTSATAPESPRTAAPGAPAIPARPSVSGGGPSASAKPMQRTRTYEAIANLWLNLLKGSGPNTGTAGGAGGSSGTGGGAAGLASPPSSSASSASSLGGSGARDAARSLSSQREYAAKYSWFLLDLLTKSLLLSTAGVRERRVSTAALNFNPASLFNPDGSPAAPSSGHRRDSSASNSAAAAAAASASSAAANGGPTPTFFKASVVKLLTELVCALTHEIFYLSSMSLSLSKLLNKNLALFLRDAFYIFPKALVFDWISLYLQISHTRETVSSSMRASSSGSGSSGSSSRFKYIALQLICDHEHYVAYNNRPLPFLGEAKKYMQSAEFGEFFMGDWQNQPKNASPTSAALDLAEAAVEMTSKPVRSSSELDSLMPMRAESAAVAAAAGSAATAAAAAAAASASASSTPILPPTSSVGSGTTALPGGSAPRIHTALPPAGHFLPFVLIKQVWLAFRQPGPVGILPAQQALLQELALAQSAYTLRSVLLKHEFDSRFQSVKKRAQVAQMYVRLLPCLWLNLDKLRTMKTEKTPAAAPASPVAPPLANGAPSSTGTTCSNARKDLMACALYVLHNVPASELLRHLQQSEYRIHPSNVSEWYGHFVDLLQLVLETTEYAGPLMRRLESITTAGGVVANLSTILCSRMMQVQTGWNSSESASTQGLTDWGGAEEIGSSRLGSLGGLLSLENKYTRARHTSQLSGHRKAVVMSGGGTLKRRDVQMSNNLQAADRARSRLAHRTLNSKAAATLLDGGDSHFFAITGLDPSIQKWEKLYAHESAAIVLHVLTQVALPIAESKLVEEAHMQDRLVWFLHGFLRLNQSDKMIQHMFALLTSLLQQYAHLIWPLEIRTGVDRSRCGKWWFELLRHCSFHDATTRAASQAFIYDLFLSVSNATGSTTRVQLPLVRAFARVLDFLRNRRSEDGLSTVHDPAVAATRAQGWTFLQADPKILRDATNDAVFIGVLSALAKSCRTIHLTAQSDPRRKQLAQIACIQSIDSNFELLHKILDTSAIIHSAKAATMDPDTLIEHMMTMVELYAHAPRMQLLYLKHIYDVHVTHANLAEAAATQFRMFQLIDKQMVVIAQGDRSHNHIDFWNSEHALSCLRKASELFESAELLEHAIHAETLASAHSVVRNNPVAVVPHQKRLVSLYEKLSSLATLGDTRPFGTYYRVGFYGALFGAMDGREFVYRERDLTKLPEITSRLVNMYTQILGREVTVFKDSGVIDRAAMELGQCKLQVTAVLPYFTAEEEEGAGVVPALYAASGAGSSSAPAVDALRDFGNPGAVHPRLTHFEKHTSIGRFFYDTPFTKGGKSHGSVSDQYKKRTQVFLSQPRGHVFPSHLKRLPVSQRVEVVLTPLQCVLEDIHKRIAKLRLEARPALGTPDIKTLTQVLSGSVNVQVNGGTAEVCQVFLAPENQDKWDAADLKELRVSLQQFVKASGEALQVAVQLATETNENAAFIQILAKGYASLVTSVRLAVPELAI